MYMYIVHAISAHSGVPLANESLPHLDEGDLHDEELIQDISGEVDVHLLHCQVYRHLWQLVSTARTHIAPGRKKRKV